MGCSDYELVMRCEGIGWHEARIPTIATMVPRGAFSWVTARLKKSVSIPLCTTNRINTPEVGAEDITRSISAQLLFLYWATDSGCHSSRWRCGHGQHGEVGAADRLCFC